MSLVRRRFNENSERDVLRRDVILFGVEPLTNAHSFGGVFEHDEDFDIVSRLTHKRLPFGRKGGEGFLS